MKHGCINLDWLEVFCIEDPQFPLDAIHCAQLGFEVRKREYGTPQYSEMMTLYRGDVPIIEVRRLPYSTRDEGGIFEKGACHIRYNNRTCYNVNPVQEMRNFIRRGRLTFKSISRCDICMDFIAFDNGDTPQQFIHRYMTDRIIKMHQSKLRGVRRGDGQSYVENFTFAGRDACLTKHINSLKWGGKGCPISTKLYNKSQEMRDTNYKSYIVDQWCAAKLVKREREKTEDGKIVTKLVRDGVPTDVWRLEFSVKLQGAKFVETEAGGVIDFNLSSIENRDKLMAIFHGLALQYWDFRVPSVSENGKAVKSNRLKRVPYIKAKILSAYVPKHLSTAKDLTRFERSVLRKLNSWCTSIYASADDVFHIRKVIDFISSIFRAEIVGLDVPKEGGDIGLQQLNDYTAALKRLKEGVAHLPSMVLRNISEFYEQAAIFIYGELSKRSDDIAVAYSNAPF